MNQWAICGLGFIAPRHIQAIKDIGDEVILTCDNDVSKKADYGDYIRMMESPKWQDVTHISICTPNYLHLPMIERMKDKIILCEKPLTLKSDVELPDTVNTVLQLRHHPSIIYLAGQNRPERVYLTVKVKRDASYWNGWKGNSLLSGGILFNLGVHYFDLLIYLLGDQYEIILSEQSDKKATGVILFDKTFVKYHLEIMDTDIGQDRYLVWDDKEISLSKQDNLSFEGLHTKVYEDLKNGKGIKPQEALKSIKLIEQIYGFNR